MNNYKDHWGRFHDKPVTAANPVPSNNGWIYTAYAQKAGVPVDLESLRECAVVCYTLEPVPHFVRSPGYVGSPISRDEILGLVALNLVHDNGDGQAWNFSPYELPKFSLTKLISQLWELRPSLVAAHNYETGKTKPELKFKHRNYFWQNNLDQLYRFAFSVPVQDRHFILKSWDKFQWYNPAHIFYFIVAKIDSALPKKSGIKWLKYSQYPNPRWKDSANLKAMVSEFPADHNIRIKLGL